MTTRGLLHQIHKKKKEDMPDIPDRLTPIANRLPDEGVYKVIRFRTPSGQFWNRLSQTDRDRMKAIIVEFDEDIEDYLLHMRQMLPANPK